MRGLILLAAGVGAYLAYRDRSAIKPIEWEEVGAKVSKTAGPVLKHTLPFIAAFLVTSYSAFHAVAWTAKKIYPMNRDRNRKTFPFTTIAYQEFSPFGKISRALTLIFAGAAVGVGLGGALMKGATSALQLSSRYFKITTAALVLTGAGIGVLGGAIIHRQNILVHK